MINTGEFIPLVPFYTQCEVTHKSTQWCKEQIDFLAMPLLLSGCRAVAAVSVWLLSEGCSLEGFASAEGCCSCRAVGTAACLVRQNLLKTGSLGCFIESVIFTR